MSGDAKSSAKGSAKGSAQPITQETAMEVMEFTPASELVQAMEARGDFKYKGIFALFTLIQDWTTKFPTNGILISYPQLERELNISGDKLQEFMMVLLGRASSRAKLIHHIPAIELNPTGEEGLNRLLVYCRPLKGDGPTARRYVLSYIEVNADALGKWITERKPTVFENYRDRLESQIDTGKLYESQAGPEIARLFYNKLDDTPEQKKMTYGLITRPVIQKLINNRKILLINPAPDSFLPNYRGVFYNIREELELRFRVLAEHFLNRILGSPGAASTDDYSEVYKLASGYDKSIFNSLPVGHKQVIMELILLAGKLENIKKEAKESQTKEELDHVLSDLSVAGRIMELNRLKIAPDMKSKLLNVKGILNAETAQTGRITTFVLHQESISGAIKQARELFDRSGNYTDALILSAMGIEPFLNPELLKIFEALMQRVYFERLPWHVRVWRALFGKDDLRPDEIVKIKQEIDKGDSEDKLKIRTVEARKEKKKLVSERLKGNQKSGTVPPSDDAIPEPSPGGMTPEELQASIDRDARADDILRDMCNELDSLWDAKRLPTRTDILEKFTEFDENNLIHFLKKYARKEVYSFRVRNEKPEYVWPILISKNYIRRKGKKLLQQAIRDADEQRAASMPNQEKFDVATAIENFLNRFLNKPTN